MAQVTGAFPYDIDFLLGGRIRILVATDLTTVTVPLPNGIASVIDVESPYTAKTGWVDIGATSESFTYTRGFDTEGWEIQQAQGNVIEEITSTSRSVGTSMAEFRQDILEIVENSSVTHDIVGASGVSTQKGVKYGSFKSLSRLRIAFIAQRSTASGIVTESDGTTKRGPFVMGIGYSTQISADDAEIEFDKGSLAAFSVGFTFFPQGGIAAGEEYGAWYYEDGTQAIAV